MADRTVASASIEHSETGADGPGFYLTITDGEETNDPIGPFEDAAAAEDYFRAAMKQALIDMVKQNFGME